MSRKRYPRGRRPLTPPGKSVGVPRAPGLSFPPGLVAGKAGLGASPVFSLFFPVSPRVAPENRGSRPSVFPKTFYYKDSKNSAGVTILIPW